MCVVKINIDLRAADGGTPVMAAAAAGEIKVMVLLIKWGADVKAEDEFGQTAVYLGACTRGPTSLLRLSPGEGWSGRRPRRRRGGVDARMRCALPRPHPASPPRFSLRPPLPPLGRFQVPRTATSRSCCC